MSQLLSLPPGSPPKRSILVPLALAVLAIAIATALWYAERGLRAPAVSNLTPGEAEAPKEPTMPDFTDLVIVRDQTAGERVEVDMVDVGAPGVWVVVAEMRDGSVWRALGAARAKGPVRDLSVKLLRPTVGGQTYSVLLYRDDGDEAFELHSDSVYVDFGTGERVEAAFRTI